MIFAPRLIRIYLKVTLAGEGRIDKRSVSQAQNVRSNDDPVKIKKESAHEYQIFL